MILGASHEAFEKTAANATEPHAIHALAHSADQADASSKVSDPQRMKATKLLFLFLGFFSTCIADEMKIIEVSNKEPLALEPFQVFGNNDLKIHVYYVEVKDRADNVISQKVLQVMVKELSGNARKAGLRINMEIYAIDELKPKGMEVEAFYSACRKMGNPEGITVTVPGFLTLPKKIYVELSKPKPASFVSGNSHRTK